MVSVGVSGLLHVITPFFDGWAMPLPLFIPIALLYLCFILGLRQSLTWLPPIVLACMVIGGIGSLIEIYRDSPVSDLPLIGIAIADFTAAAALVTYFKAKPA